MSKKSTIRTILLVDDEPRVIQGIKNALRKEPYRVLGATSASAALEILRREDVTVVVSDQNMPGMSGSDFLKVVCREHSKTIRIMLTGHASLDIALEAINQGEVYRLLTKPCSSAVLASAIRDAILFRDLTQQSSELLKVAQERSAILDELERQSPGITTIKEAPNGAIEIDVPEEDVQTLLARMQAEIDAPRRSTPV